jgi:hypothetical protein
MAEVDTTYGKCREKFGPETGVSETPPSTEHRHTAGPQEKTPLLPPRVDPRTPCIHHTAPQVCCPSSSRPRPRLPSPCTLALVPATALSLEVAHALAPPRSPIKILDVRLLISFMSIHVRFLISYIMKILDVRLLISCII